MTKPGGSRARVGGLTVKPRCCVIVGGTAGAGAESEPALYCGPWVLVRAAARKPAIQHAGEARDHSAPVPEQHTRWLGCVRVSVHPRRFWTLLDPTYAKKFIPIVASVSEHQPTTWSSYIFDLHLMVFAAPAGLYFCFKRLTDSNIFLIVFALTAIYFSGAAGALPCHGVLQGLRPSPPAVSCIKPVVASCCVVCTSPAYTARHCIPCTLWHGHAC